MDFKGRAQCLVVRDNKILMVKHNKVMTNGIAVPAAVSKNERTPD